MSENKKKKKKKSKLKRLDEEIIPDYNIPGVVNLVFSDSTQKHLELIVGEHVTSESPWKVLHKSAVLDELQNPHSELASLKEVLTNYPEKDILFGYHPDEAAEIDDFYICTTPEVRTTVEQLATRIRESQERKLYNSLFKTLGKWQTLGSEADVKDLSEDQRFRSLFEVEIDCRFPVIGEEVKFRNRDVDSARDGYIEILPGRAKFNNIYRLRVDASVQVTQTKATTASQTVSTFPTNVWTQYLYEYELPEEVTVILSKGEEPKKTPLEKFLSKDTLEPIYDQLIYNSCVNLYYNDYSNLEGKRDYVAAGEQQHFEEYVSFADIGTCHGKQISSVSWHPMWTGIVACAYVDAASCSSLKSHQIVDEAYRAVHGDNPVLLWSFQDSLQPKIQMMAPREVRTIAFCPFDENILIGGCVNGQVILWDITNRLGHVERTEILTTAQQRYRNIVSAMMKWFKNVRNDALMPPTAVAALETCHTCAVTEIRWLPPYFRMGRNGRFKCVEADEETSLQFMTCGEDGEVLVWDLRMMPTGAQLAKSSRVSRRLGKRLEALTVDVSKYKVLDRILQPIYKFTISKDGKINTPLSGLCTQRVRVRYEEIDPKPHRKLDGKVRVLYKPIVSKRKDEPVRHMTVATCLGDVAMCNWSGYKFDGGANINSEACVFTSFYRVHDGPVTCIARSPFFEELTLTVGGKVMAIWREDFYNCPIMQRRCSVKLTHCSWSLYRSSCFNIAREDGAIEVWDLINRMDRPSLIQSISGKYITGIWTHRLPLDNNVIGIADHRGTFRIFFIPKLYQDTPVDETNSANDIFLRAKYRKENIHVWQNIWKDRHKQMLEKRETEYKFNLQLKASKLEREQRHTEELAKRKAAELQRRELAESKHEPGKYSEWAQKKFEKIQERRMHNVLLKKKKLNRNDLVKHLAPLKRISDQIEYKKIKQEKIFSKKTKIFNDAVAVSFPETHQRDENLDRQIAAITEPGEVQFDETDAYHYFTLYEEVAPQVNKEIKMTPYRYTFSMRYTLAQGNYRRLTIDLGLMNNSAHRERYNEYRATRITRLSAIQEDASMIQDQMSVIALNQMEDQLSAVMDPSSA